MEILVSAFADHLRFEKRYSRHTVLAYQEDLSQFFVYLKDTFGECELADIKTAYIRSWLAGLKDSGLLSRTLNRKISSLRSFFKFQHRMGTLRITPMTGIISPKAGKRLPVYVEEKDLAELLAEIPFPEDWSGKTEHLMIGIFYNTGMRLSELTGLKDSQVDLDQRMLRVLGKGNKERLIPISPALAGEIAKYGELKRSKGLGGTPNLLVNERGRPLYAKYAYLAVNKWLSLVTTVSKKSPHVLRHSFATHLMNHGADLNSVKELLGHASLAATQLYTHNSIEKLRSVHRNSHPRP